MDIIGFVAGILYRGLRYISIPTSIMSVADSAYGGKTGVNLYAKNQLGIYSFPEHVYSNTTFAKTLPEIHYRSGLQEIVKLCLFREDIWRLWQHARPKLFDPQSVEVYELVKAAALLKLQLLDGDPMEKGPASLFLYGHAFGNAFESYAWSAHDKYLPHGYAVGLGMLFSGWIADAESLTESSYARHQRMIGSLFPAQEILLKYGPRIGRELTLELEKDKYCVSGWVSVPGLGLAVGYSRMRLSVIEWHYASWRNSMLRDRMTEYSTID